MIEEENPRWQCETVKEEAGMRRAPGYSRASNLRHEPFGNETSRANCAPKRASSANLIKRQAQAGLQCGFWRIQVGVSLLLPQAEGLPEGLDLLRISRTLAVEQS
uniref:Uncharacterized protein n=1 Tax=Steinernema glaseri TaxID=37863 RepID=A0A1I7Z8H9_9BILA